MKQSIKAIKRETGKHRKVIRRVLELAGQEGWLDAERELPSEHELQEVYHEQRGGEDSRGHPLDAHRDQIKRWHREGYSFLVIHKLLQERGVEYSETTVRRYIHRQFPAPVRPVMRRETKPGEVLEVDFGHLGLTWDAATRLRRRTWVFSGRLRHSRRAYREVVFDQKQETFFACHMHAFEWFGGVPEKVTPDNLKAAVIVASFEGPLVNRAYRELALHYGFLISPCLPRRPEHKGGVEGDMKYVKRNFLPLFREAEKERGRDTPDAGELAEELERWNRESCDQHVVQKVGRTPLELFESEAGAPRRQDRHRGQELSHGQLRASLTGTAAAITGPAMRPYRPGARGCPGTTSPGRGALQAVLVRFFPDAGPQCAPKPAPRTLSAWLDSPSSAMHERSPARIRWRRVPEPGAGGPLRNGAQ